MAPLCPLIFHIFKIYICFSFCLYNTSIFRQVRGPESQVVSQQLHNQSAVLVWLLTQGVQFRNCLIKSLLRQMAGPVKFSSLTSDNTNLVRGFEQSMSCLKQYSLPLRGIHYLVVEDREVESKAKTDWVGWREVSICSGWGSLTEIHHMEGIWSDRIRKMLHKYKHLFMLCLFNKVIKQDVNMPRSPSGTARKLLSFPDQSWIQPDTDSSHLSWIMQSKSLEER